MSFSSNLAGKDLAKIDEYYGRLPVSVKRGLTDFYNAFVGVSLLHDEKNFEMNLTRLQEGEQNGHAIPTSFYWRPWYEKNDISVSFIREFEAFLIEFDQAIISGNITRTAAKVALEVLHHYLYGN